MPDFRQAVRDYIAREARPVDKFGHQPRLYALTRLIGAGLEYDDDIVFAAAWLHDLGVFVGHRPEEPEALARWDNVAYALERTPAILAGFGFPSAKIPGVLDAIRTHQPAADPPTIEAAILRDADILEQLGAIAVLRTVSKVGRDTRFATFTSALDSLRRSLSTLPSQLRLESSRRLAEPKIALLQLFINAVDTESGDFLF